MIVFDLCCPDGHRFEGWFTSSDDYSAQQDRGLVSCPQCGAVEVSKAPMAPAVPRKGNQASVPVPRPQVQSPATTAATASTAVAGGKPPPEVVAALGKLAEAQTESLKSSTWVGDKFAEESRAMHYGERDAETIHGNATVEQAKELLDEGITLTPLPFPVTPPDKLN